MERRASDKFGTRRSLGTVLRVALTVSITLLVIELMLRMLDPLGMAYFPETARYFRNMEPDDAFAYIHRSGYRDKLQGVDVSINSDGFRAPELRLAKDPGAARLLIIGDSVVFGWGAPQDSIFPSRLQRRFEREGKPYQVISAGVGSWNTRTEYEYLRTRGLAFDPDIVLVVATNNDVVPNLGGHTDVDKALLSRDGTPGTAIGRFWERGWRAAARRSFLLAHAQYFLRRGGENRAYAEIGEDSPRWQDAEKALNGIIDLCRDENISLVFCLYTSEARIENESPLRLYRAHLDAGDVPVILLPDALFFDKAFRNSFVDGHANSRGHALIAKRLCEVLEPMLDRVQEERSNEQG